MKTKNSLECRTKPLEQFCPRLGAQVPENPGQGVFIPKHPNTQMLAITTLEHSPPCLPPSLRFFFLCGQPLQLRRVSGGK